MWLVQPTHSDICTLRHLMHVRPVARFLILMHVRAILAQVSCNLKMSSPPPLMLSISQFLNREWFYGGWGWFEELCSSDCLHSLEEPWGWLEELTPPIVSILFKNPHRTLQNYWKRAYACMCFVLNKYVLHDKGVGGGLFCPRCYNCWEEQQLWI